MMDPERISRRQAGLAAELLQAGTAEQPAARGMERTLAALGVSGALVTAAGAAGATAAGATAAGAVAKTVTSFALAKWIGAGVIGGVALSGAAALVTAPAAPAPSAVASVMAPATTNEPASVPVPEPHAPAAAPIVESAAATVTAPPRTPAPASASAPAPALEVGVPLAAEVAAIDRARALLASGQAEQGLAELLRYEREFPEARLLPEVLFLRMETCARLGRDAEARGAALRLLKGFPQSPHAARARELATP